ncbi:MAG: hypothetical protein ACYDEX_23915, partial [Mobilitalea sp.]
MYLAELHGKLPHKFENWEDILTSNVFSFFKYSRKDYFLRELLKSIEIQCSIHDINKAEFIFWPTYDDKTEPDLVIKVGNYYLLFEAKLFSDFGKENNGKEAQLIRELEA